MTTTFFPDTFDDIYVVPSAYIFSDSKETDITYFYWCYFQIALIHSWREK